ncbi:UNVERIFIED_CONTAM: hypothetical protein PYX00_000479 [Menopon gallinae]|uniref:Golgi to ER traffic protein 4 homolog n=1 Tax=Menopon gallinae TaxID=328185 RepID=A0AAW2IAI7_9NEOP
MAAKSVHGVERVRSKLDACIKSGNYYEAHQMYRTLYFRYLSQQKYSALLELLCDGAFLLLEHNQQSTNALRWSLTGSEVDKTGQIGHPQLHQMIAEIFWKEKNYVLARYHYLHSTDGHGCAAMLVELHNLKGYPSEVDLFIAQAVLQYLCLQNKKTAAVAFSSYTTQHPNIKAGPPYLLPLLNFIWFLLKAIESGKLAVFRVLCERYKPIIKRDPTYSEYLDRIAQIFFGVPPPPPKKQNVFGNLFQSFGNLFNDMNDSDSDEGTPSTSTTSTHRMETEDVD